MKGEQTARSGYGRLLDAWSPPDDSGEPIGCVATSFTFQPDVFEEDCLTRFLQIESAVEDGASFLIEREEKLAKLHCAAALVDQRYARGSRNLRWDLLPARTPRGSILHAKVSLLLWSRRARLIVASANLTKNGCRVNHEIFGVLDYHKQSDLPLGVLDQFIVFLTEVVDLTPRRSNPAVVRWESFLKTVTRATRRWGSTREPRGWAHPRISAVITGAGRKDVFKALEAAWPYSTNPPDRAVVLSPFFDPPEKANAPARQLWSLLRRRGSACVEFHVDAEDPTNDEIVLHAPESLMGAQPSNRADTSTDFLRAKLEHGRPLHAKSLKLENERAMLLMVGSSNFTSSGFGIAETSNIEANLCYAASRAQSPRGVLGALDAAWLPCEDIRSGLKLKWLPVPDHEDTPNPNDIFLPEAFVDAILLASEPRKSIVEFTFDGDPPTDWRVYGEDNVSSKKPFLKESDWRARGTPKSLRVEWPRERPPSGFLVEWKNSKGSAWWPVNASSPEALPPPAELENLPLEALVEVLTSSKPIHIVLARIRKRKRESRPSDRLVLDPHKLVDVSSFLLQRTRRVSRALEGMRERLERPVMTEAALAWRLRGPVGPLEFARAISEGAYSPRERCFLLVELCLELSRVQPGSESGALSRERVGQALKIVIEEIRAKISPVVMAEDAVLRRYYRAVQAELDT